MERVKMLKANINVKVASTSNKKKGKGVVEEEDEDELSQDEREKEYNSICYAAACIYNEKYSPEFTIRVVVLRLRLGMNSTLLIFPVSNDAKNKPFMKHTTCVRNEFLSPAAMPTPVNKPPEHPSEQSLEA
ncbi:hypothetical protein CR513_15817, partial [Mucuna pruriens]